MNNNTLTKIPTTSYLDLAVTKICNLGIKVPEGQPVVSLLDELQPVDESKAVIIAKTLQHATSFNELVRSQVADMQIGFRYQEINDNFGSILNDFKEMLSQIQNERNGFKEKFGRFVMKWTRGTVHDRFNKIRDIYLEVTKDTKDQLNREKVILEAYLDYRGALKEGEILAAQMAKTQLQVLESARLNLKQKNDEANAETDFELKASKQLARDEAERNFSLQDRRYQLIKEISEQLSIAYNVGDTVLASLNQTRNIKQSVYDKAVIFFTTNESVFTSLDASLTADAGLNESRRAVDALSAGMNRGLETLAEVGNAVKIEAVKTAYGSNIKAQSVQKLVDSLIQFRTESTQLIKTLRAESTKNTEEITKIVDEGKDKFAKLITE